MTQDDDRENGPDTVDVGPNGNTPEPASSARVSFPIVGVGASAGGLDAYKRLLETIPADPGFALILVQHLDPTHESMMADLLDRHCALPVKEAEDAVKIERNHVYVIPPNKFLRLADHGLFLDEPIRQRGARMPIDYFFRSLAEAQHEMAVCIVLSGTGTDGTQGLREIKAAGGIAIVQDPRDAEYDGMPRSAIGTGMADFVMPAAEMPKALLDFVKHPYLRSDQKHPNLSRSEPDTFRAVLNLLLAHTDYDFRCYKTGTLERRIQRRMSLRNLDSLADYLKFLRDDREELTALFKDLLIGVTRFFRDAHVWDSLQSNVIAPLVAARGYNDPIRVWIPGCATGEEAYTIAILFFEEFEKQSRSLPLQMYATDLDEDAIEVARAAQYPDAIAGDVSRERLERFFVANDQSFTVAKRLRETIVFATQNVISDPPFSRLDLISCRNLMIYLDAPIQNRLLDIFHFALNSEGTLLLGTSESTEKSADLFERMPTVERAFRRREGIRQTRSLLTGLPGGERKMDLKPRNRQPELTYQELAAIENVKNVLLDAFAPASVLIDRSFNIRYFHGPLRKYLDFPKGEPVTELTSLAFDGLKGKLRALLNQALTTNAESSAVANRVRRDDELVSVRITVRPVLQKSNGPLLLVSFEEDGSPRPAKTPAVADVPPEDEAAVQQLEFELQALREDYQSAIEELETSNEELKASNEEVMSMNEELQSTNEELETSREELQSLNEELSTLNAQLQEKLKELEGTNNDLNNLLTSTDIATIFLDTDLRIRRFTPAAKSLLNVIESDAGRPFSDLAPRIADPELASDSKRVLYDLQPREADVTDEENRAFMRRVRPYRTSDNRISGVVVTYSDVSRLKNVVDQLRDRERQQAAVADLGLLAAGDAGLDAILQKSTEIVAENLGCSHVKVLELDPDGRALTLRAESGFTGAVVGKDTVTASVNSQAGYTLSEEGPVIVENLSEEKRFKAPPILTDHGIVSGISVIIGGAAAPWGVLGAHATESRTFSMDDVSFVQSIANLLRTTLTEAALQEERDGLLERLDNILGATHVGTWIWLPEEDRVSWDDRLRKLLGIPEGSDEIADFYSSVHPDDRERVSKEAETAAEGGEFNSEFRVVLPDDSIRWVAGFGRMLKDQRGRPQMVGINYDITERVSTERSLAESEQRREMALDAADMGTWEWRPDSEEVRVDDRLARLLGLGKSGTVAFNDLRSRVHPDDWDQRLRNIDRAVREESVFKNEFRIFRDGEERWVHSTGRVYGSDGDAVVVGLASDITDRKREEERRQLLMAELDHRVKNILANVNAIARQTGYSQRDPDAFIEALEGRLSAMADAHSLLSVTHWSGVDLEALLEAELSPFVSDTSKRIKMDGEPYELSPKAAPTFCLFLHELMTNAAKYGALKDEDGSLRISWTADEDRNLTFEWEERISSGIVSKPTSRGFGLSVIEEMATSDLGADVTLEFRPGGLYCRLIAPGSEVGSAHSGNVPSRSVPLERNNGAAHRSISPKRILIVEDVWTIAMHLKSLLENRGHTVLGPANRLDEGLALAEMDNIDAAILDVRLNDQLVFPLAEALDRRGIPFGFATGYDDAGIIPEELASRPIMRKPYVIDSVDWLLDRMMADE